MTAPSVSPTGPPPPSTSRAVSSDPARSAGSRLRSRRGVVGTGVALVALVVLYANFMVPLLRGGLADAPMVTLADPTTHHGDFVAVSHGLFLPGFEWISFLLVLATLALGPLVAAVGVLVTGWVTVAEARARRLLRAALSALTWLGFTAVLVLSLSPWVRTAKAWFFD